MHAVLYAMVVLTLGHQGIAGAHMPARAMSGAVCPHRVRWPRRARSRLDKFVDG